MIDKVRESPPTRDSELIELFADDPEGLALVDAIGATQRARRRTIWSSRPVMLAAAVVLIAFLAGALSLAVSRAGTIQRALKAVSVGDVVHLRLIDARPIAEVVDLRTGSRRAVHFTIDEWLSRSTAKLRTRVTVRGQVVQVSRGSVNLLSNESLLFARNYRRALSQGRARSVAGASSVNAHAIVFDDGGGKRVRIELDRRYRPLLIRYSSGQLFRVVGVGAGRASDLRAPQTAVRRHETASVAAARVVQRSSLTSPYAGRIPSVLAGLPLRRVRVLKLQSAGLGRERAVEATYGVGRGAQLPVHYLRLTVATRPLTAFGWSPWYVMGAGEAWLTREGLSTAFFSAAGLYEAVGGTAGDSAVLAAVERLSINARS